MFNYRSCVWVCALIIQSVALGFSISAWGEGPLKIEDSPASEIVGHPNLTRYLQATTLLGEGEFGRVYRLGESGFVLKVEKDPENSLSKEPAYWGCLQKHLAAFPKGAPDTVPTEEVTLRLENGKTIHALLKSEVKGQTLLHLDQNSTSAREAKRALEAFIENWILLLTQQSKPQFALSDFKMSNLMWGTMPLQSTGQKVDENRGENVSESMDRLILIDVNCFDDERTLAQESILSGPAQQKNPLAFFANSVLMHFEGHKNPEWFWTKTWGKFKFQNAEIQNIYESRLIANEVSQRINKSTATSEREAERLLRERNEHQASVAAFKKKMLSVIKDLIDHYKANESHLSEEEKQKLKLEIKIRRMEQRQGAPYDCDTLKSLGLSC